MSMLKPLFALLVALAFGCGAAAAQAPQLGKPISEADIAKIADGFAATWYSFVASGKQAIARASIVFPVPGTSFRSTWPFEIKTSITFPMISSFPRITFPMFVRTAASCLRNSAIWDWSWGSRVGGS